MTTEIMAYATTGREFEVMADLSELGVTHWPGMRIEFERRGKSRIADPYVYPALPNYLHITAPFSMLSAIMDIRHLSRTVKFLHRADVASWQAFQRASDARLTAAQHIIAERDRMATAKASRQDIINLISTYKAGDALEISSGAFAGMLATFGRMVVKPGNLFPMVEASVQLFGQEVLTDIDPLNVRKAG